MFLTILFKVNEKGPRESTEPEDEDFGYSIRKNLDKSNKIKDKHKNKGDLTSPTSSSCSVSSSESEESGCEGSGNNGDRKRKPRRILERIQGPKNRLCGELAA